MSFTENAKKIVVNTAETVVKASGDILENSKLKYKIYDAKIDLKKAFEDLGRAFYTEYITGENLEDEREDICVKIREIKSYIEDLRDAEK